MTTPTVRTEANTSTNGTDPVSLGDSGAITDGDLLVVAIMTYEGTAVPSFVLHNGGSSLSYTTEDGETISGGNDGAKVYKDGSASTIAYDYHLLDATNGGFYVWSIKITSHSGSNITGLNAKITYGGTVATTRRAQQWLFNPQGYAVPVRASRVLATWLQTGGATGAGNYTVAKSSGTIPSSRPCAFIGGLRAGGGSGAPTVDVDNDGNFNLTTARSENDAGGQTHGRVINISGTQVTNWWSQLYDSGDGHYPHDPFSVNYPANPTAAKTEWAVLYALAPVTDLLTAKSNSALAMKGDLRDVTVRAAGKASSALAAKAVLHDTTVRLSAKGSTASAAKAAPAHLREQPAKSAMVSAAAATLVNAPRFDRPTGKASLVSNAKASLHDTTFRLSAKSGNASAWKAAAQNLRHPAGKSNTASAAFALLTNKPLIDPSWVAVLEPAAMWQFRLVSPADWRVMSIVTVPASTLEYLPIWVRMKQNGAWLDPTSDPVETALTAQGVDPVGGDWVAGDWTTDSSCTPHRFYARRTLNGVAAGSYDVWCRITDDPEVPVRRCGTLKVI
jgi:hypothetical protein